MSFGNLYATVLGNVYFVVLANFNVKVLNNLLYLGFRQKPLKILGKPLYNGIGKPLMLDNQTGHPFMSCHWAHLMRFWAVVYWCWQTL